VQSTISPLASQATTRPLHRLDQLVADRHHLNLGPFRDPRHPCGPIETTEDHVAHRHLTAVVVELQE
jgi:hypothetical protein